MLTTRYCICNFQHSLSRPDTQVQISNIFFASLHPEGKLPHSVSHQVLPNLPCLSLCFFLYHNTPGLSLYSHSLAIFQILSILPDAYPPFHFLCLTPHSHLYSCQKIRYLLFSPNTHKTPLEALGGGFESLLATGRFWFFPPHSFQKSLPESSSKSTALATS